MIKVGEREGVHYAQQRTEASADDDEAEQEEQVIGAGQDVFDAECRWRCCERDRAAIWPSHERRVPAQSSMALVC